jgi:hypothetical protein
LTDALADMKGRFMAPHMPTGRPSGRQGASTKAMPMRLVQRWSGWRQGIDPGLNADFGSWAAAKKETV